MADAEASGDSAWRVGFCVASWRRIIDHPRGCSVGDTKWEMQSLVQRVASFTTALGTNQIPNSPKIEKTAPRETLQGRYDQRTV